MQDLDIQVGDRVTFITDVQSIVIQTEQIEEFINYGTIAKVERIGTNGWYTVYEKEKELLTEEEKEILKAYIKWIRNLNNGEITNIYKTSSLIILNLKTGLDYTIEIGTRFYNLVENKRYTLSELGLEE